MDHNSIIDRKTFEVYTHSEDYPKAFICDKPIAEAVAILNKKGYKTFASCSGHYKVGFDEFLNVSISNLEEVKKDKHTIIRDVRDDSFDYWSEIENTYLYVLFDKEYHFDTLPNGFVYFKNGDDPRTDIDCEIKFYHENGNRKNRLEIENEIDNKGIILKNWAESLPDINERNDYNE